MVVVILDDHRITWHLPTSRLKWVVDLMPARGDRRGLHLAAMVEVMRHEAPIEGSCERG